MTRARDYSQGSITGGGGAGGNVSLADLLPYLTTSNVAQRGANLYFSNTLSFANLQLASLNDLYDVSFKDNVGNSIATINQGLIWNGQVWTAGYITANLAFKTTDDLNEGLANLYYSNSRARRAFTAADPTIVIDWVTGTIRANLAAVASSSNTTDGLPEGFVNKYFSNTLANIWAEGSKLSIFGDVDYPVGTPQPGHTLIYSGGKWIPGYLAAENANFANSSQQANIVLSISNFTTANLTEFGNLYYTDERVYANIANASIDALRDVWTPANSKITGYVLAWDGNNWYPQSTANIGNVGSSSSSLFAQRAGIANVALLANQANTSYYANVAGFVNFAFRSNIANIAMYAVYAETANNVLSSDFAARAAQVSSLSNFTSDDLREGNINLYFTNQKVLANVQQMRLDTFYDVSTSVSNVGDVLTYNGTNWVPGNQILQATRATFSENANVANTVLSLSNFDTNNLEEGSNNLYYTTARLTNDIQSAIYGKDIELDDLTLFGDLTVRGNTVLLNVSNVRTESRVLTVADAAQVPADAEGAGIYIKGANARISFGEVDDGIGINKNLVVHGNLIPSISGRFSIGTASKQWRDLYLGATTLYVGGISIGSDAGGLVIKDQYGNAAGVQLSNVAATQSVTVNRVYSNTFPLTEFNSYIGGNTAQFVNGQTANLYVGILKGGDFNKFAGMRIVETKDGSANVRSDLHFITDNEATSNSRPVLSLFGTGNVAFTTNVITVNDIRVIDNSGHFVGNSFLGTRDVDLTHGGTGANTAPNARKNLFGDMAGGLIVKYTGANTLGPVSLVAGTGVTVTNGDAQTGSPTIAIGQPVAITDNVQFRDLTLSGNLYILGNVAAVYSNTLIVNDPMIQVGYGNPGDGFDLGWIGHYKEGALERHAGIFRDHVDKTFKVFDNLTSEPGLNDLDTSNVTFRYANIAAQTFVGNVIGYVSTLNNHTTAALNEGSNNLYYTNSRVVSAVVPLLTTANVIESTSNLYFTNARVIAALTTITTANVAEASSNLYFTPARVNATVQPFLTTANVIESSANLYFTNARAIAALANATISGNLYLTDTLFANSLVIRGINVTDIVTSGNITAGNISAAAFTGNSLIVDTVTANISVTTSNLTVTGSIFARANTRLTLGNTVVGSLVSNAVTLTTETSVTDSITQLNQVLGKLVPARPPAIGSTSSIGIQTLSTYRMTAVTQTDRTSSSRTVPAGTSVAVVRRASTYTTNTIANVGLGDNGTVSVIKNGADAGSRALTTSNDNGVYGDLTIINNVDYSAITGQASGFWESFRANASGTVSGGWNEVYITHTTGGTTPTAFWYYDATSVAAPQFTNTRIGPTANVFANSSTVPHYTSATNFMLQFDVNRLSGDMFPTSNTFITGTSGGAFLTPTSVTYASANISFPLAPNLYVASGSLSTTTNVSVVSGFGVSALSCSLTADNSYNTGAGTFTPVGNVLYKTGTSSAMEETNHTFSSTVGTGSGLAARIENPGSTDNPVYTANAFLFNPQTSTLNTYDATIVAAILKHDQVNYSTGYMPVGPNLSTGRSAAQYYTFKFVRTSVSKFDIQFSGTIAGMWVALPGSTIDNTSSLNGWLDMSVSAVTSGIPGANTGAGGNGSNGCALGGPVTLNSLVSSHRKTCTFGTVSSSSTATNEIYVRIKLTAGQTVSALTLQTASN